MKITLILVEPKKIILCHQFSARPACTSMRYDQALYCWFTIFKSHLDILKMIINNSKNGRWIIIFKKFSMLWVNGKLM